MLLTPVTGGVGQTLAPRVGVDLVGVKDGSNKIYVVPWAEKFVHNTEITIVVIWSGRRLYRGKDFDISESGGVGTGYDTVDLTRWESVGFLPLANHTLTADYYIDLTA